MDLNIDSSTYAITTGGYESALPSESVLELEDVSFYVRSRVGGIRSEEVDLAAIFNDSFCLEEPVFSIQFGRSSNANDHPTYQALGKGLESLEQASKNVSQLSHEIEEEFDVSPEYSTHRPLIRAHTTLQDRAVLYTELYYHSFQGESVKHFELNIFLPEQPFGTTRYDGIFERSPVRAPAYIEEADVSRKSGFKFIGYDPERISITDALDHTALNIGCIENPLKTHGVSLDGPWRGFTTPTDFFPELYCMEDEFDEAKITSARAVSIDHIEPVFYNMEVDR